MTGRREVLLIANSKESKPEEKNPLERTDGIDSETDGVNNPKHYNQGSIEVYSVIEDWKLNYNLGNVVKYIGRCEHKGKKKEDLQKAMWYLQKEIEQLNAAR